MRLRSKLVAFNLATIAGVSAVFGALGIDLYRLANLPAQEQHLRTTVLVSSGELARQSDMGLAANDRAVLSKLLSGYAGNPDFAGAVIWSAQGEVLAQQGSTQLLMRAFADKALKSQEDGGEVAVLEPVNIEGMTLGTVGLSHSRARLIAGRQRMLIFVGIVLLALGIGVFVSIRFAVRLTEPIQAMTRVAERLAAGDLSQEAVRHDSDDEIGTMAGAFNTMVATLRELSDRARRVADGELGVTVEARGGFADAFREMVGSIRRLVAHISETAAEINSSAGEIYASAGQQQQGALHQSSAVEETRRTMESLLTAAGEVAEQSSAVLGDAESTQKNNTTVGERIRALATHTERISEILEKIKDIANKSDLLALNAALEGTKAGEAGRGFSLVAAQMQRLAENVMEAVRDIKTLTDDIREATSASALATEQGIKLAASTTSSARKIALIIQQQRSGTEQVTRATDDVLQIAKQTESASKQSLAAAQSLNELSQRLQTLVQSFKL